LRDNPQAMTVRGRRFLRDLRRGTKACSAHSRARGNPGQQAPEFAAPGSPLSPGRAEMRSDSISSEHALETRHHAIRSAVVVPGWSKGR
jgi:hypothetical protein